jgi:dTMP kinase
MTREPGGTRIGDSIREILLSPSSSEMDARTEALLYAADRAQHVAEVIRPALQRHRIVLSDRFVDSSLAYQGLARGLGLDEIYRISEWATGGLMPDLVFFLRLDPQTGLRRIDEPDRMEQAGDEFHERVSDAYMELARRFPSRFVVLDADQPASELHQQVVRAFEEKRLAGVVRLSEAGKSVGKPGPIAR